MKKKKLLTILLILLTYSYILSDQLASTKTTLNQQLLQIINQLNKIINLIQNSSIALPKQNVENYIIYTTPDTWMEVDFLNYSKTLMIANDGTGTIKIGLGSTEELKILELLPKEKFGDDLKLNKIYIYSTQVSKLRIYISY